MKVLVGCEESQVVCKAFRARGHEAYSCDLQECSGGHPEWHFQEDVFKAIEEKGPWDLMIAHPPCTYLANSGVQHLHKDFYRWGKLAKGRAFMDILNADIPKKAIENPIPHRYANLPRYNQIIQPYYFGDEAMKKTCLWLFGLPPLMTTLITGQGKKYIGKNGKPNGSYWYQILSMKDRGKMRSKTFPGIAEAMSIQWGQK